MHDPQRFRIFIRHQKDTERLVLHNWPEHGLCMPYVLLCVCLGAGVNRKTVGPAESEEHF